MSRYGRMRASFDSESSLVPSPPLSPTRHGHPVYFVQSPSRESTTHDVDSLSQSFSRATPRESPMASPMHKHFKNCSSSGSTSFNMATTAPKPGSRRVLPHAGAGAGSSAHRKGYNRAWAPGTILEEEGPELETKKGLSRCCIFLIAVLFSVVVFFIGALVFWLITMPHKPKVTVQVGASSQLLVSVATLSLCVSVSRVPVLLSLLLLEFSCFSFCSPFHLKSSSVFWSCSCPWVPLPCVSFCLPFALLLPLVLLLLSLLWCGIDLFLKAVSVCISSFSLTHSLSLQCSFFSSFMLMWTYFSSG